MALCKYKDWKMADVPAQYLLWLHENGIGGESVKEYIRENMDVLIRQVKQRSKH